MTLSQSMLGQDGVKARSFLSTHAGSESNEPTLPSGSLMEAQQARGELGGGCQVLAKVPISRRSVTLT